MYQWTEQNLGQWHYVIGYFIVLFSHNWQLLLALGAGLFCAIRLYRQPNRARSCWLLAAVMLAIAYEYAKHVSPQLHQAVNFLFHLELAWLNLLMHIIVGPVLTIGLYAVCLLLVLEGIRQSMHMRKQQKQMYDQSSMRAHSEAAIRDQTG